MARGLIEERFKKLLDKTTFTESDVQSYTGHVNSIAGRLRRDFQIKKLEVFGSASVQLQRPRKGPALPPAGKKSREAPHFK